AFTAGRISPEPESAWRYARKWWSATAAGSGSSPSPESAPPSISPFPFDREWPMSSTTFSRPVEILLVEDNPGDVRLTREALREGKVRNNLHVASDGVEALKFLRREEPYAEAVRPDLILLDLNLPRKDGREVLEEVKADPALRHIPVVVLTSSQAEQDILRAYDLHANCYVTKPVDLDQFIHVVRSIEDFWFTIVKLPPE